MSELIDPSPQALGPHHPRIVRIVPAGRLRLPDLRELVAFRELLYLLVWRDITVRYKQTALGVSWAILQPVLTTLLFSLFFGRLGNTPSEGVPYPLFSLAAVVPFTFFSNGLLLGSNSLVLNAPLITKVYFPRILMPVGALLAGLLDFLMAFVVLLGLMAWYGYYPGLSALWLPLLVLMLIVSSVGVTAGLAAINVRYRDVRYVVPFLSQLWLFATPIAWPLTYVPSRWWPLVGLNPLAGVVQGFRTTLLHTNIGASPVPMIAVSALSSLVLFVGGVLYFHRVEHTFADVV